MEYIALSKVTQNDTAFKLFRMQIAALGITLGLLAAVFFVANGWILSDATTAMIVLTRYLLWFRLILWVSAAMFLLSSLLNIVGICVLARKGCFSSQCIGMAALGISVPFLILLMTISGTSSLIGNVESDIIAIETGKLVEDYYHFDISWENFFRRSSLQDFGGHKVLYVAQNERIGRHYFPMSINPAVLRELASQNYQHGDANENFRRFNVAYTPYFQIIVSAEPVKCENG